MNLYLIGGVEGCERELVEKLIEARAGKGSIRLYVNSRGGDLASALAIVGAMRALDVTAVVLGECHSAALLPFAAAKKRLVMPWTTCLFHVAYEEDAKGDMTIEDAKQFVFNMEEAERQKNEILAELLGVKIDVIDDWSEQGRYVTAKELAEAGLVEILKEE